MIFWSGFSVYFQRRLTKRKKKVVKNQKFEKQKQGLEISWTCSFSQNLASIRLTVSEKKISTDVLRRGGRRVPV